MMARLAMCIALAVPLYVLLQAPSVFAIYRYSPWPEATLALAFVAYVVVLWIAASRAWPMRLLDNWIVPAVFIAALWAAIYRLYFYVKSLPASPTSDTALMAPLQALKQGRGLYDLENLIGVPASPGPGWVLVNAPFTFAGQSIAYTLLTPVYVLLGWLALRATGQSSRFANLWMLLLFSGLIVWELAVGGYDIIAISVVTMALYLLVERFSLGKIGWASLAIAMAVGVFGTSRIVFPYLAPLLALVIWKHDRVHALVFALVALSVTAALHAAFYFTSEFYHPFHLFGRAQINMGPVIMGAGAVATGIVLVCALIFMKRDRNSQLGWFTLALGTPFVFIAVGEFAGNGYSFDHWEGGNYLVPVAATAILYALRMLNVDRKSNAGSVEGAI